MAKQKKDKRTPKKVSPAAQGKASRDVKASAITAAILQLRGRRAFAMAKEMPADETAEPGQRERLTDTAHEAYVRELLDGGHEASAVDHVMAFTKEAAARCDHWALSLQCRLGLVADVTQAYTDAAWRERLRRELVDPEDLIRFPLEDVAADARSVLEAWRLADENQPQEARRKLADVGRRSLLVDWRLFVQAYLAAREGHGAEVDAACRRMQPNTPAAGLAGMLVAYLQRGSQALAGSELASLLVTGDHDFAALANTFSTIHATSGMRKAEAPFRALVRELTQARRRAAAAGVVASVFRDWGTDRILDLAVEAGLQSAQVVLQLVPGMPPEAKLELLHEALTRGTWQTRERAILLQCMALNLQRVYLDDERDESDIEEDELFEDEREDRACVVRWCRESAALWPELHETYRIWRWAERPSGMFHADKAEAKAFPLDPESWQRLVQRTAALARFQDADEALTRLEQLHGSENRLPKLKAHIVYQRLTHAFDEKQPSPRLHELAALYAGEDLFERVGIAVRLWLRAQGPKEKQQLGKAMNAIGAPWLVLFFADLLSDTGVSVGDLPVAVRRSLRDNPGAVATDFLALSRRPERSQNGDLRSGLIKSVLKALADAQCPLDLTTECLRELALKEWHEAQHMLYGSYLDLFLASTARMLKTDTAAASSACALALRAWLYVGEEHRDTDATRRELTKKLLRAAAVFAVEPKTKALVREVVDLIGGLAVINVGNPTDEVRAECEAIWRQQCTICTPKDYFEHIQKERVGGVFAAYGWADDDDEIDEGGEF